MSFPQHVTIAAIDFKYVFEFPTGIGGDTKPRGMEGRFLETLSQALHFKYSIVTPAVRDWGSVTSEGNWTGLIGMVTRGDADLGISLTVVNKERLKVVDFSSPHMDSCTTFATRLPKDLPKAYTYWYSFDLYTWLGVFTLLFVMPFVFQFLSTKKISYEDLFWYVYGSILSKSYLNGMVGGRLLSAIWWFTAPSISFLYMAALSSFIFLPLRETPVKNFEELEREVSRGEYRLLAGKGQVALLQDSGNDVLIRLAEAIEANGWFITPGNHLFEEGNPKQKTAVFDAGLILNLQYGMSPTATMYISEDDSLRNFGAIAVNKDFCCKKRLDSVVSRIKQAGLFWKYLNDEVYKSRILLSDLELANETKNHKISLEDISGALLLLLIGYCASMLAFILEIVLPQFRK